MELNSKNKSKSGAFIYLCHCGLIIAIYFSHFNYLPISLPKNMPRERERETSFNSFISWGITGEFVLFLAVLIFRHELLLCLWYIISSTRVLTATPVIASERRINLHQCLNEEYINIIILYCHGLHACIFHMSAHFENIYVFIFVVCEREKRNLSLTHVFLKYLEYPRLGQAKAKISLCLLNG